MDQFKSTVTPYMDVSKIPEESLAKIENMIATQRTN
jgi:hypothetical protein